MDAAGWHTVESDPGVFTLLIQALGAKGVQVEELWSIDDGELESEYLRPVHGLIFLFKWRPDIPPAGPYVTDSRADKIYFVKQVIDNACATQAVVSVLLNCKHHDLIIGEELTKLKEFTMSFDPTMRGLTLTNSEVIRTAHNSMSQQSYFEFDCKTPSKSDDVYHYVAMMPIEGRLYELDGLRPAPIDLGPVAPDQDWLELIPAIVRGKLFNYDLDNISFNLMAIISDRRMLYEQQLTAALNDPVMLSMEYDDVQNDIPRLRMLLDCEQEKFAKYQQEMARRRHNYIPFIIEFLKILAEEKQLLPLYERSKDRSWYK